MKRPIASVLSVGPYTIAANATANFIFVPFETFLADRFVTHEYVRALNLHILSVSAGRAHFLDGYLSIDEFCGLTQYEVSQLVARELVAAGVESASNKRRRRLTANVPRGGFRLNDHPIMPTIGLRVEVENRESKTVHFSMSLLGRPYVDEWIAPKKETINIDRNLSFVDEAAAIVLNAVPTQPSISLDAIQAPLKLK